jgi:hypothetical protein
VTVSKTIIEDVTIDSKTEMYMLTDDGTYIYSKDVSGNLYRAPKSTGVWVDTGQDASYMWAVTSGTYAGRLIRGYSNGIGYSTDYGATWTEATTDPSWSQNMDLVQNWSFAYSNSVMVICEYDVNKDGGGQRIFASVDGGVNWTTAYDAAVAGVSVNHFHCIGYQKATGTFVAFSGDGAANRHMFTSANGVDWTKLLDIKGLQPVTLTDFGHATDLLAASDRYANIFRVNALTGATTPVITNWYQSTSQINCFASGYFDGLYWASQYQEVSQIVTPAVCVSEDGINWAVVGYFDSTDFGVQFFSGVANGYMYATVNSISGTRRAVRIKVPNLRDKTLVKIEPATTNSFGSENLSVSSTSTAAWNTSYHPVDCTLTLMDTGGLFSTKYVKATKGSSGKVRAIGTSDTVFSTPKDGLSYVGRVWVKGTSVSNDFPIQFGFSNSNSPTMMTNLINNSIWVEYLLPPMTIAATGGTDTRIFRYHNINADVGTDAPEFHFGGWGLSKSRGGFQIGGTPRTATSYTQNINAGSSYTNIFNIITDVRSGSLVQYDAWSGATTYADDVWVKSAGLTYESIQAGNINHVVSDTDYWTPVGNWCWHVASWQQDNTNYIVLVHDAVDGKFKLRIVVDGVLEETLAASAAAYFEWKSQINFGLRVDAAGVIGLTINIGDDIEHLNSTDAEIAAAVVAGYMRNKTITFKAGDMSVLQTGYASAKVDMTSRGDMTTVPMWIGSVNTLPILNDNELVAVFEEGF